MNKAFQQNAKYVKYVKNIYIKARFCYSCSSAPVAQW